MNSVIYTLATRGLQADLITIEVENYRSNPGFVVVGLGDTAVQESRERVRAAIKNSNYSFPRGKVVVNLAPADIHKAGPCFDLPIAIGLIALANDLEFPHLDQTILLGELALDGSLRHIDGILGLTASAAEMGFQRIIVPEVNAEEAALIADIQVIAGRSLQHVIDQLFEEDPERVQTRELHSLLNTKEAPLVDFGAVKGQVHAKRGLEIAAAGSHNIIMNGSPGSGKTMLAKAFKGILPPMNLDETLEVTKLYSLSGLLPEKTSLIHSRPFRTVHHTASGAALVGGGRVPKPGEISLAHRGVLFLDEMNEFSPYILDLLRQPLEDREITISRTQGSLTYPAQFILCGATNPCPCGYYQITNTRRECVCTPGTIARYQAKLSGPLLDRIDLYCHVSPVKAQDLQEKQDGERSAEILKRVQTARQIQFSRFKGSKTCVNSEMSTEEIIRHCKPSVELNQLLQQAIERLNLSARSYHRVLKVSRTIADLAGREEISTDDAMEALQYRRKEPRK